MNVILLVPENWYFLQHYFYEFNVVKALKHKRDCTAVLNESDCQNNSFMLMVEQNMNERNESFETADIQVELFLSLPCLYFIPCALFPAQECDNTYL